MRNLSTFNKIFLVLCAAVIVFLAFTVPQEREEQAVQQQSRSMYDE